MTLSQTSGWFNRRVHRDVATVVLQVATLVVVMTASLALFLTVGHSHFVVIHVLYVPVILAAYWLYSSGGALAGLVAGLGAGPLLALGVTPASYPVDSWLFRLCFLVAFGAFAGFISQLLAGRLRRVESVVHDLTRIYARTLRSLMCLLEHHDEETSSHCERVARNSLIVGKALGLNQQDLEALYWAGYMHDLGKLATPAGILLKPGSLTREEYAIMQEHAAIGADTVAAIAPAFHGIAEGIRSHHERWDGKGYPRGIAGAAIPLTGRILAVADTFEAMTSNRPYRPAMQAEEARIVLQSEAGRQLDEHIVTSFLEQVDRGAIQLQTTPGEHTSTAVPMEFTPGFLSRRSITAN